LKKDQNSTAGKRMDEMYQMDRKGITDASENSRKRRKVMPDSKVHVVNELVDEGKSESESDSDSK
jgi:hypothetical protein